ncbi:DUF5060 domain-containing protein [Adhaeribacter pallidiroseus]|uniref:Dystroglycan-type cadherin-like domain-containing protein n=1 Tax=Adhaeribacter pallidiroseus TaxID=2072847 RepID=A0A369QFW9_9BACT|nr:DUF5060 domain-containing protein [Adhaeribacter pallidiroseus]RDC63813.1 hypothetical protein AHMF7616_02422 [Adhaeribacter pallidiroseus]
MKKLFTAFFKFLIMVNLVCLVLLLRVSPASGLPKNLKISSLEVNKNKVFSLDSTNESPVVLQRPANQTLMLNTSFYFAAGAFTDSNSSGQLTYTASRTDGTALPTWLKFNRRHLSFRGIAPATAITVNVRITATDPHQATASTTFRVRVQPAEPVEITGELRKWHKITFTFAGPLTSELDSINPFLDYRLNVIFKKGTRQVIVPGYYTADGKSSGTGANYGNKWRAHFTPDETGEWTYQVSFRTGSELAISTFAYQGQPVSFDNLSGSFTVENSDKTGRDFRAQGRLQYTGKHYLQFAESKKYFLKGGAGSPENFLAYRDFDNTYSQKSTADYTKTYAAHIRDWKPGDPVWRGNKGKGIIGAINYLASKGMNSVYFLTLNVNGDGQDVWPWISPTEKLRYDVSKLAQWETVFSHMDELGLMLHVITQEQENDQLLDGGNLKTQRKLYYRELIARFGHHLGITWNLGEENTNTNQQRKAFSYYLRFLDPYKSPIDVHSFPEAKNSVFTPLLGYKNMEGASLQIAKIAEAHQQTQNWVNQSANSGRNWVVTLDEIGPSYRGVLPDSQDYAHDLVRKQALWGHLMAGGGGVEWYFGYRYAHSDLTAEDWRSRKHLWELTNNALWFFNQYLPFWDMKSADTLTTATTDYCLAAANNVYAIYLPTGGTTDLNVGSSFGNYQVHWFNPRTRKELQKGSVLQIQGTGWQSIGVPPQNDGQDWVCLVTQTPVDFSRNETGTTNATLTQSPANSFSLAVYPNPVQDYLTIQTNATQNSPLEITLLDVTGKQILNQTALPTLNKPTLLNIRSLMPGVYFLRVKQGAAFLNQKIVKY